MTPPFFSFLAKDLQARLVKIVALLFLPLSLLSAAERPTALRELPKPHVEDVAALIGERDRLQRDLLAAHQSALQQAARATTPEARLHIMRRAQTEQATKRERWRELVRLTGKHERVRVKALATVRD